MCFASRRQLQQLVFGLYINTLLQNQNAKVQNKTRVQAGFDLQFSNEAGMFSPHPDLLWREGKTFGSAQGLPFLDRF